MSETSDFPRAIEPSAVTLPSLDGSKETGEGDAGEYVTQPADVIEQAENANTSSPNRALHVAKRALETAVITTEVLPTNGVITYGPALAILLSTKNPLLAAGYLGGSTALLEGSTALATADVLSSGRESKLVNKLNEKLKGKTVSRFVLNKEGELHPVAEGLLATYAGTAVVMTAKEADQAASTRTKEDRRRYGLKVAGVLGAMCTAQGLLYSEGILNYKDPKVIVPVVASTMGFQAVLSKLRGKIKRAKDEQESSPRYDLTCEELSALEEKLLKEVDRLTKKPLHKKAQGIYGVWIPSRNKYANILRTNEAKYFPEVSELTDEVEDETLFLAMVDTRTESRRVVHATTISGVEQGNNSSQPNSSGFITIDELIDMGNFTAEEFREYYRGHEIDTFKSISVDTNFRVGQKVKRIDGIKTADLAYLTVFQFLDRQKPEGATTAVFASINRASIISFKQLGLEFEPLMGRSDLVTPESLEGKDFLPVMIPNNTHNSELFKKLGFQVPEISLT